MEALGVLPTGGHGDDAGARRRLEQRQQAGDQGERPDHHRRQRRLDAVGGDLAGREDGSGVVDHDVEPRLRRQDLVDRRRALTASEAMSTTIVGNRFSPCRR